MNRSLRKIIKTRGSFPNDDAANGSKLPARSRGIAMSISPSSAKTVFALVPLRLLPLPRPAGSPFS
jgi:hypothetical protein